MEGFPPAVYWSDSIPVRSEERTSCLGDLLPQSLFLHRLSVCDKASASIQENTEDKDIVIRK